MNKKLIQNELINMTASGFCHNIAIALYYRLDFYEMSQGSEVTNGAKLFDWASITKGLLTVVLLETLQKEKETLHTDIRDVAGLKNIDVEITYADLLTFRCGIFNFDKYSYKKPGCGNVLDAIRISGILSKNGKSTKGEYEYSNHPFMIIGDILSRKFGKPISKILEEKIFTPSKCWDAGYFTKKTPGGADLFIPTEICKYRGIVRGIVHDESAYFSKNELGHTGAYGSATDLLNVSFYVKTRLNSLIRGNPEFSSIWQLQKSRLEPFGGFWFSKLYSSKIEYYMQGFTGCYSYQLTNGTTACILTDTLYPNRVGLEGKNRKGRLTRLALMLGGR